jgi:hypothetical protein
MRERRDAELGLQMHLKTIPRAREPRERNRPAFSPEFVRKCPNFEGLATINGGKSNVGLFSFSLIFCEHFRRIFFVCYPEIEKLSEVLLQLNETSLSQLRRDHETGHLEHKIAQASK